MKKEHGDNYEGREKYKIDDEYRRKLIEDMDVDDESK